jgi:hypothetical protein
MRFLARNNLCTTSELCHRLNLGLGELFPEVGVEKNELNRQLVQAEFNFILREYQKAEEILDKIDWHTDDLHEAIENGAEIALLADKVILVPATVDYEKLIRG